jgi:hypothetical protein
MDHSGKTFQSFPDFYPYYLSEHADRTCRRLHFVGTTLVIATALYAVLTAQPLYLLLMPLLGYGFAWVGHFFFEKNKPATFKYPLYSLIGDFAMYRDIWSRRIPF